MRVALYLRSSKDRHDLSLDAQRRALHEHAASSGLVPVVEYADAVESGADADRPGFQRLLAALRDRERGWSGVLALDTSRIARRRHLALIFEHEAEKAGVTVIYRLVSPDGSPWSGEWSKGQSAYRLGRGPRVSAAALDAAVLDAIFSDLSSPDVAARIAERMRAQAAPADRPRDLARLRSRAATLARKIARLVDLIADDPDAAPAYRRAVASMESEREALQSEIEQSEHASRQADIVRMWTSADVARLLGTLRETIEADRESGRVRELRIALSELIERIEYDSTTRSAVIRYRLDTGVKVASPRGSHLAPVCWDRAVSVPRRLAAR
jgi:DNA invertase Pin-like site-specific DNA recombinase